MVNKTETTGGMTNKAAKPSPRRRAAAKVAGDRAGGESVGPKKASPKARKTAKASGPSQADIALRAYLIGECRMKAGLPGDALSDWLQAERELGA
jgi:hypothetical protein